jgi:hypothetical protein
MNGATIVEAILGIIMIFCAFAYLHWPVIGWLFGPERDSE